ncbi:uncharacterized protein CLUP02_03108 [Colletotrichum lupini]|uniref:Uncharacterized protein n=1 Tax=Colletotrichum lupini TaxID=145971 RepID=A0A9Q8SHY9_9PEZI|nr:uncharacterized protein CLUP02_03108 [Colletotrichum lupini]UQC77639.1 hypothetical protein CLUP02_03108 [Colletotrichum lupini]
MASHRDGERERHPSTLLPGLFPGWPPHSGIFQSRLPNLEVVVPDETPAFLRYLPGLGLHGLLLLPGIDNLHTDVAISSPHDLMGVHRVLHRPRVVAAYAIFRQKSGTIGHHLTISPSAYLTHLAPPSDRNPVSLRVVEQPSPADGALHPADEPSRGILIKCYPGFPNKSCHSTLKCQMSYRQSTSTTPSAWMVPTTVSTGSFLRPPRTWKLGKTMGLSHFAENPYTIGQIPRCLPYCVCRQCNATMGGMEPYCLPMEHVPCQMKSCFLQAAAKLGPIFLPLPLHEMDCTPCCRRSLCIKSHFDTNGTSSLIGIQVAEVPGTLGSALGAAFSAISYTHPITASLQSHFLPLRSVAASDQWLAPVPSCLSTCAASVCTSSGHLYEPYIRTGLLLKSVCPSTALAFKLGDISKRATDPETLVVSSQPCGVRRRAALLMIAIRPSRSSPASRRSPSFPLDSGSYSVTNP